jgi:predicted dinucleotide-binding enzyme
MATLGLIGSGRIGGTLARLAVDAGLDVVLSNSRGPQTLSDLVDELGPRARAGTPAQAAAAGDWVVVTIPVGAIGTVPRESLVGKTVIDTGNYFAPLRGLRRRGRHDRVNCGVRVSSGIVEENSVTRRGVLVR